MGLFYRHPNLLFLLGLIASVLLRSDHIAAQVERCTALSEYRQICREARTLDRCSSQLTSLCCTCQGVWGETFDLCAFQLALVPTPTPNNAPTPTPVPPQPTATPTSPPNLCLNGTDANGDGRVDSSGDLCITEVPRGCRSVEISGDRGRMLLTSELLRTEAKAALRRLAKSARSANDIGLTSRLKQSQTRMAKRLDLYFANGTAALQTLPEVVLVCSESVRCDSVDNRAVIARYRAAVGGMAGAAVKALNRATRLLAPLDRARKDSQLSVRVLRQLRASLLRSADRLPAQHSVCRR